MHIKLTRRATADHVFCVHATTCVSASPVRRICGKATAPVRYADRRLKIYLTCSFEVLGSQHARLAIIFHSRHFADLINEFTPTTPERPRGLRQLLVHYFVDRGRVPGNLDRAVEP